MAVTTFDLDDVKRRMQGAISALKHDLGSLRTGRASASLLEPIQVDAYGSHHADQPGCDGQRAGAAAPQRPGLGPRHGAARREGDPRIRSRPQPADRGPGHPPAHPGDDRAAPQGDGQGRAQIRRGGPDRGPPRPARRPRPPEEAREGPAPSARTTRSGRPIRCRRRPTRPSPRSTLRLRPRKRRSCRSDPAGIAKSDHERRSDGVGGPGSLGRQARERLADPCRHHHGRQRPLGGAARPAARRGPSARRRGHPPRRPRRRRARHPLSDALQLLVRELAPAGAGGRRPDGPAQALRAARPRRPARRTTSASGSSASATGSPPTSAPCSRKPRT